MATKPTRIIKHPSWRVYKAVQDCSLDLSDFHLKNVQVHMPYTNNDDLTTALCSALNDPAYTDTTYEIQACLEMFMGEIDRQLIDGMLLNNKSLSEICDVVGCSDIFAITYSSLFFDTSVFKNNVEKMVYVREGTCGEDAVTKKIAITKGDEFLKIKNNVPSEKLNMDTMLADTFAKAYVIMQTYMESDDISSQEIAQGWGTYMLKMAAYKEKKGGSDSSLNDLTIALQTATAPKRSFDNLD